MAHPTIELSFATNMSVDFKAGAKKTNLGDGQSQRFRKGLALPPQKFQLNYSKVSDTDSETLRLYYEGKGAVDPVTWQPDNQPTALKWIATGFSSTYVSYNVNDVRVNIEQVFDN